MSYPHPDLLTGLAEILHEIAGTAPEAVVPEATFLDDLDVDSLAMVEVVVACEERFGVRIPDEALEGLTTVQSALDYIATSGVAA